MISSMKFLTARPLFSANAAFRATGSLFCLIAPLVFCSDLSSESAFKARAKTQKIHKKSKKRLQLPRNPTTLTMSPDNTYAYVSYEGSHTIHKVDPITFVGYESIELQKTPAKYVLDAACSTLYVLYDESNEITLIDLATGKQKYSFLLDPHPKSIAVSANGSTIHVMQEWCDYLLSIDCNSGQMAKSPMNEEELFHSITHKIKDIQLSADEQKAYISYENSEETSSVDLVPLVVKPPKEPEYPFLSAIFDPIEEIIDFFTIDLTPAQPQVEEASSSTELSSSSSSSSIQQIPETFASEFNGEVEVQEVIDTEQEMPPEIIAVCDFPKLDLPFENPDLLVYDETPEPPLEPVVTVTEAPRVVAENTPSVQQKAPEPMKTPTVTVVKETAPVITPVVTAPVAIKPVATKPVTTDSAVTTPAAKLPTTKPVSTPTNKQDITKTRVQAPQIAYLATAKGPTSGGTAVRIIGSGFTKATSVKFGPKDAAQFTVHSETLITAIAPTGTGTVDVTVRTNSATSAPCVASKFTFETHPIVIKLSPETGSPKGGKTVTIRGYHFDNVTDVKFGDTPAKSFKVVSPTMIKAVTPKGSDTVDVTVVTTTGSSATNAPKYTYEKKSKTKNSQKKKKK